MKKIVIYFCLFFSSVYSEETVDYYVGNIPLDSRIVLNDFAFLDHSESYWSVIARLQNISNSKFDFVKLKYYLFFQGEYVAEDYSYIDYDTYENYGMIPNSYALLSSLQEKVDFDSIQFEIEYELNFENNLTLNTNALIIIENKFENISYSDSYDKWVGKILNVTNTPIQFPSIYTCIYKNGQLVQLDYTYLNVDDNTIQPNELGEFDGLIVLPTSYDSAAYFIHYSIGLTGYINSTDVQNNYFYEYSFHLSNNYPNPFNSSTTIEYQILIPDKYELNIFNINGQIVKQLFNKFHNKGNYQYIFNIISVRLKLRIGHIDYCYPYLVVCI